MTRPTAIAIRGIDAVVVFAADPRRLADWYGEVFAARRIVAHEGFYGLDCGGLTLFVQRVSEGHSPGLGGVRPHVTVDDCRAAFDGLLTAGAAPLLPVTDVGAEWVAAVTDPEGNPIGLLSRKTSAPTTLGK